MRIARLLLSGGLFLLLVGMASQGQQPGSAPPPAGVPGGLVPQGVAPGLEYQLTPQAGAWLICAGSFTGPDAPELARQMVSEIRDKWKLSAYVFNRADEERRKQKENLDRAQQETSIIPMRKRTIRVEEQCAVLVGGYADVEAARKALSNIKTWKPPTLKSSSGRPVFDKVFIEDGRKQKEEYALNPFQMAFVTRNPLLPPAQQGPRVDPMWWKLNQDNPYSLLDCKKPWTLVVKQYTGAKSLVAQETGSGGFLGRFMPGGNKTGEVLDAAAKDAQELARVLRLLNFYAYVLHTRTSSVVTIGGFQAPDDPELLRVRQQLAALQQRFIASGRDPFRLYPNPAPMEVPRKQ